MTRRTAEDFGRISGYLDGRLYRAYERGALTRKLAREAAGWCDDFTRPEDQEHMNIAYRRAFRKATALMKPKGEN